MASFFWPTLYSDKCDCDVSIENVYVVLTGVLKPVSIHPHHSKLAVVLFLVNSSLSFIVAQLTENSTCITVMQTMTLIVDKLKPAFVTCYRYYDVGQSQPSPVYSPVRIEMCFSLRLQSHVLKQKSFQRQFYTVTRRFQKCFKVVGTNRLMQNK